MRPLQVPTTPIVNPDGSLTNEWKIFLSEVIRTTEKLGSESVSNDAAIERLEQGKLERGIWYNKLLS